MLNVTLRTNNQTFKLGLQSINGSTDAYAYHDLVKEKLSVFGLDFNHDIVSSTHDGESMMAKYGRIAKPEFHLCLNHVFHLGVRKVIYPKRKNRYESIPSAGEFPVA